MRAVVFLLAVCFAANAFCQSGETICINGKCYRIAPPQQTATGTIVSERVVMDVPAQTGSLARSVSKPLPHHAWGLMAALARVTGTDKVLRCDGSTQVDFGEANVILLRSRTGVIEKLVPRLAKLRRGTRVVSYGLDVPDQCTSLHSIDGHDMFLWIVGDELPANDLPDWLRGE